jgi:hypothetical protein
MADACGMTAARAEGTIRHAYATLLAERRKRGVIGLLMSILVWIISYTAHL